MHRIFDLIGSFLLGSWLIIVINNDSSIVQVGDIGSEDAKQAHRLKAQNTGRSPSSVPESHHQSCPGSYFFPYVVTGSIPFGPIYNFSFACNEWMVYW
jgi:hypothetical protein